MSNSKLKMYRNGTDPIACRLNAFPALDQGQWARFHVYIDGRKCQAFHRLSFARRKGGTATESFNTYVYMDGRTYVLSCICQGDECFTTKPQENLEQAS